MQQRNLKFRAYDKQKEQYIVTGFNIIGEVTVFDMLHEYSIKDFNNLIVEQFIGLKDKNEVDIYEGDILTGIRKGSNSDKLYSGIVRWQIDQCGFVIQCDKYVMEILSLSMHGNESFTSLSSFEVTGNIHQPNN